MSNEGKATVNNFWREIVTIGHRGRQVWKLIPVRQRWTLCVAIGLMVLGGACNTAIPLLLGRLVDVVSDIVPGAANEGISITSPIGWCLGFIAAAYLLREAFQLGRRYLVEDTSTRLHQHLFVTLVAHLLTMDLTTLSFEKIGALSGRINRSVAGSVKFLRVGFLDFVPALLSGGFALTAVFVKQPWLALAMAAVIPISLVITVRQLISQKGVRLDLLRLQEEMDGTVVEQLSGINDIRAANKHEHEIKRVTRSAENLRARELRHHLVMSLYGSGKAVSEGFFHILVLGVSVYFAATGRISVGDILTYSMLFLSVLAPLNEIQRVIDEGHESSLLVGELLKFLSQPADRSYQPTESKTPTLDKDGIIRVENLFVDYNLPDGGRRCVVDRISLGIRRGEIIGIAGRSGSGKTTLLRILMRLHHPDGGEVELGNVPLDCISRTDIARMIGYVCQTPFVFSGTIAENIAYEKEDASEEQIHRAAWLVGLDDEIKQMVGGYSAKVTERGQNLSGGQRQRLALARVFLKDPPILILDEATSALDTISERRIQEALAADHGDRTVILVAHRLTSLAHTDRIITFDGGRIAETGTYEELVARGGVFSELVQSATEPLDVTPGELSPHSIATVT